MNYELKCDESAALSARPSPATGAGSFATLGFLNSGYVLAAESTLTVPVLPPSFQGAPGDPAKTQATWYPDSIFWANRQFVNAMELAFVPLSSPGQLMQEFSGTNPVGTKQSLYAASFSNEDTTTNLLEDPRMPTAPISANATLAWPNATVSPFRANANDATTYATTTDDKDDLVFTPFSHLLNFFQESPELSAPNPIADPMLDRFPKNTSMAMLLDLVETPSPWNDSSSVESPVSFELRDWSLFSTELQPIVASNNVVTAALRAPYNRISKFVEPGRINLNTMREPNVFQGLWSNTLTPSDIDFPPYAPASPFGGPEDIDHNKNGIREAGERASPQTLAAWDLVKTSRQGYTAMSGFFNPGGSVSRFNPHYPTEFAGLFKPASEAGMVPYTRNPIAPTPGVSPTDKELNKLRALAAKKGVLDLYTRQAPAHATLMRGAKDTAATADTLYGIPRPSNDALIVGTSLTQRHVFTDRYPITRIANLTSNRSNVFAVYVTIGLFEYDQTNSAIGIEYGADKGEVERFKAFYIIDRTVPVGYRTGEDHNIEKTILVRRYLNN